MTVMRTSRRSRVHARMIRVLPFCAVFLLGLLNATGRPIKAQGPAIVVADDDTNLEAPKFRTRWALQPFIGASTAVKEGEFAISRELKHYPRPLVGGKIMMYPSSYPRSSWELSGYFQLPVHAPQRLSQLTLAVNLYTSDYFKPQKSKVRPFASIGVGRLANNNNNSEVFIQLGTGFEFAADSRFPVPIGIYWVKSTETNRLFYMSIGINLFQN